MDYYIPNRACYCARCRCRGYMGPVIMITLGVLFLLSEFTQWRFHQTWPILLIAIGVTKVLGSSADTTGHIAPYAGAATTAAPVTPEQNPPQGVSNVQP